MRRKHFEIVLYLEDGWGPQNIQEILESKRSVKRYAFMLHDHDVDDKGAPEKAHYHVYCNCGQTSVDFKNVANWFDTQENRVNKIETNMATVLRYYTHENQPDKHPYPLENMVANFDVKAFLEGEAQKASIDELIQQCADGTITPLNYTQYIDPVFYAKYERKIQAAWKYAGDLHSITANGVCERTIIWLYGREAVGKGELCKMVARNKNEPIYFSSTGNDPFGEYRGQPIAVLDDLRPLEPFSFAELLKITDPHNRCSIQSRYRNKDLTASLVFITSPFSPIQFVEKYHLNGEEGSQLYRRLSEVWHVTKGTVSIHKYDMSAGAFVETSQKPNPVPHYLAALPPVPPALDGDTVLDMLYGSYVPAPIHVSGRPPPFSAQESKGPDSADGVVTDNKKEVLPF